MKAPFHNPANDEAVEALAAAWLVERDAGLDAAQVEEFARWRQADPRHEAAVLRLEGAWGTLQQLREFRPAAGRHPDYDLLARPVRSAPSRLWPALALAAAVALVLSLAAVRWWPGHRAGEPETSVYATTGGGYQRVALADGSVLELNAESEVRVAFTAAERRVRLARGEAFFTVAKNPARPFVVDAGGVAVRAVGTAFGVRLAERNVEVLVTEGRVKVEHREQPDAVGPELAAGHRLVVPLAPAVAAGQAVAALPQQVVSPEAQREALAWQGPRLRFVETPLAQVAAEFNRRNQVQLELGDPSLASLPVDGSFRAENVEAFVRLLESDGEIRAERPTPDRIVLRRGP